jgi:nitrate reductase cytochrome c-type subunit
LFFNEKNKKELYKDINPKHDIKQQSNNFNAQNEIGIYQNNNSIFNVEDGSSVNSNSQQQFYVMDKNPEQQQQSSYISQSQWPLIPYTNPHFDINRTNQQIVNIHDNDKNTNNDNILVPPFQYTNDNNKKLNSNDEDTITSDFTNTISLLSNNNDNENEEKSNIIYNDDNNVKLDPEKADDNNVKDDSDEDEQNNDEQPLNTYLQNDLNIFVNKIKKNKDKMDELKKFTEELKIIKDDNKQLSQELNKKYRFYINNKKAGVNNVKPEWALLKLYDIYGIPYDAYQFSKKNINKIKKQQQP